jgi:preprotein translocase subunit YajC
VVILLQAGTRLSGSYLIIWVLILAVFYFLMIRPQQTQQRKRREMLGKLKKGDRIVTVGGLHAIVHDIDDDQLTLELAPNLRVKADRAAVSYVRTRKAESQISSPVSEAGPPRP